MTENVTPRYEFRVFENDLGSASDALSKLAQDRSQDRQRDTYIVSRLNIDTNVKVRENRLELKVLEAREGLFELWRPVFEQTFPIDSGLFIEHVAPRLGIDLDVPKRSRELALPELLSMLSRIPAVHPVTLEKERVLFNHGDARSEATEVVIGDASISSVAVESADIERARELAQAAGIAQLANESYPAFLQRITFD